jgi:hypothetical protein
MNIAEILIWEATNFLLLISLVIGVVMVTRWFQGRPVFTDRDWRFLFGRPREKVFSLRLWLRFVTLWFGVAVIGFAVSFYLLPYGLTWFTVALLLLIGGIFFITPKWLR